MGNFGQMRLRMMSCTEVKVSDDYVMGRLQKSCINYI